MEQCPGWQVWHFFSFWFCILQLTKDWITKYLPHKSCLGIVRVKSRAISQRVVVYSWGVCHGPPAYFLFSELSLSTNTRTWKSPDFLLGNEVQFLLWHLNAISSNYFFKWHIDFWGQESSNSMSLERQFFSLWCGLDGVKTGQPCILFYDYQMTLTSPNILWEIHTL